VREHHARASLGSHPGRMIPLGGVTMPDRDAVSCSMR
jgi:hypothetical protein